MKFEHTPEPWRLENGSEIWADVHIGEDQDGKNFQPIYNVDIQPHLSVNKDGAVSMLISYDSWRQFPSIDFVAMQKANSRIMIVAPKMLNALVKIYDAQINQRRTLAELNSAIKSALPLIKEAVGKTWEELKEE